MDAAIHGRIDMLARPLDFAVVRESYKKSTGYTDAFDALNRACYWDPGEYELTLVVESDGRPYSQRSRFTMVDQGFQSLRFNVITTLDSGERSYTGIQPIYYFAYPRPAQL